MASDSLPSLKRSSRAVAMVSDSATQPTRSRSGVPGSTLRSSCMEACCPARRRARSRDVTWAAITLALVFLLSTLVLGLVLLHNIHTGFIADSRVRVLATHLHVAIVGWALIMIVGVLNELGVTTGANPGSGI